MARGKVAEWIRKRTAPRKKPSAGHRSKDNGAAEPILAVAGEAAPECWSSAVSISMAPRKAGGTPARSKSRARAFLPAALRWRPRVNVLVVLWEQVMWLVESVVVVGRLIFFLMRFGFKQL